MLKIRYKTILGPKVFELQIVGRDNVTSSINIITNFMQSKPRFQEKKKFFQKSLLWIWASPGNLRGENVEKLDYDLKKIEKPTDNYQLFLFFIICLLGWIGILPIATYYTDTVGIENMDLLQTLLIRIIFPFLGFIFFLMVLNYGYYWYKERKMT